MNFGEHLALYCERRGAELTAEPLNALSNIAFFYMAWRLWKEAGPKSAPALPLRCLSGLIFLVGAGSLAFHTFATGWARILDLAFIGIFNLLYLVLFLRMAVGWSKPEVALAAGLFLGLDRTADMLGVGVWLYGSGTYLPALLVLLALDVWAWRRAPKAGRMMAGATAVFLLSLGARTVDQMFCGYWPWGTHFVWHVLNAWVLYRLGCALSTARQSRAGSGVAPMG